MEMEEVGGRWVMGQDLGVSLEAEERPEGLQGTRMLLSRGQEPVQHGRQFSAML